MGQSRWMFSFFIVSNFFLLQTPNVKAENVRFDLERRGNEVCKFNYIDRERVNSAPICYPLSVDLPPKIEVMDQVRELLAKLSMQDNRPSLGELIHTGGIIMLTNKTLAHLNKNYRRISIRNFAVNPDDLKVSETETHYSFFADVYWQSKTMMEGTLHVEGRLIYTDRPSDIEELFAGVVPMSSDIFSFSDSRTEWESDHLRFLTTVARNLHFIAVDGLESDADEETLKLLNEVIGPVIVGEVFLMPTINLILEILPELSLDRSDEIINEILEGLNKLLEGLGEPLDKSIEKQRFLIPTPTTPPIQT